jgi:hypothetical protein
MKILFMSPQSILWRKILVAQVFNLCWRRLKPAATFFIRPNPLFAKILPDTTEAKYQGHPMTAI